MTTLRAHGTRARYVIEKCRCAECREANRQYYHQRKEWVNGYAPAPREAPDRALAALKALRHARLGWRTIAAAAGISRSALAKIRNGTTKTVNVTTRERLEELVGMRIEPKDGQLVDARPTIRRINRLLAAGWTRARISQAVGNKTPALQFAKTKLCTGRIEKAIRQLVTDELGVRCHMCGKSVTDHPIANNPCRPLSSASYF